jgi:hypothetical protein|tara:strand:- start:1009 stop:2010 length:1002 start_codon:yes stop_codon:yes gene_type:complete
VRLFSWFVGLFWGACLLAQGVSYVKYFATEEDFVRGSEMLATGTSGRSHIQALYDKQDRVLSKTVVTAEGEIVEEEVYEYDLSGTLTRRAVRDGAGLTRKLYIYGGNEPMSDIFIRFAFPHRDQREFKERTVLYEFRSDGEIEQYRFFSVDNREFGRISYDYFESGVLKKEEWNNTLSGKTVRLFNYQFNPHTREYRVAEYDSSGTVISRSAIVLPDQQFPDEEMPGISGDMSSPSESMLQESGEIIQDIIQRKSEGWNTNAELGRLSEKDVLHSPDIIYLTNGDTLKVDLLHISNDYARCILRGESEVLSIPLSTVGEIERRDGKILYPIVY